MRCDGRLQKGAVGSVCAVDENDRDGDYVEVEYWDEASGKQLDVEGVKKARAEEMGHVRDHGVYVKVPVSQCWGKQGSGRFQSGWRI